MTSHGKPHDNMSPKHHSRTALTALCSLLAASSFGVTGCVASANNGEQASATGLTFSIDDMDLDYTDRDQDPSYDEDTATKIALGTSSGVDGAGATANGSSVEISQAGTYLISGTAIDGQILVDCTDEDAKVQLVLDGVSLTCSDGPAIYVKAAGKCFVTLASNSKNTLADTAGYTLTDDTDNEEPAAALFSKADLTLQGDGQLTVKGNCNNGIGSKDDLVITGGSYKITAANDGLRGRDCVKVLDGTFKIKSAQDAVKSNNDEDTTRGFVKIDGGTWSIAAGDDAFHAETAFILNGGVIDVKSCYEGYEGVQIYLNGATTKITASDDAINAAGGSTSDTPDASDRGKNFEHDSDGDGAPDGERPDAGSDAGSEPPSKPNEDSNSDETAGNNGTPPSEEAGENSKRQPQGGEKPGGNGGGKGGGHVGGGMDADASCLVQINGGTITLDSGGDGIDSNGALEINGGDIVVYGPTSGGDGALDYGTTASINGGSIIALGSSGMAANFTSGTQAFALVDINGCAGDTVSISGSSDKSLLSTTAAKSFETAVVSCSSLTSGSTYTIKSGKSSATFTAQTK